MVIRVLGTERHGSWLGIVVEMNQCRETADQALQPEREDVDKV